ncbi:Ig-like domain-containing protein [Pseudoalteromonas piratica]|uniref:Tandem-95 repeat protein n=1 Tax=Pseudoalteromonas piratica TaxID=1348114 RepID=A0A0A7EBF5_9GAMM|nr:Ig-like domain-containing protein [Pseudoalteromonas piratica]AIY63899.1 hypothetical protein OM33_01045 [Pseudoalteromonas piratica]
MSRQRAGASLFSFKCCQLVTFFIMSVFSFGVYATPSAVLIADLNADAGFSSDPKNFVEYLGKLYFSAESRPFGQELWQYDGITATMVADLNTDGYQSGDPKYLTVVQNKLYFVAATANSGYQIFVYDGQTVGFAFDSAALGITYPEHLIAFNNKLYFSASNTTYGKELHEFNPETGAVSVPEDVIPGTSGTNMRYPIVFNNMLYYYGSTPSNGSEVWQFDGTTHVQFFDIRVGSSSSSIEHPMIYQNALYFKANIDSNIEELVRITADGVVEQVSNIGKNGSWAGTREMTEHQGKLYFRAKEESNYQLWRYDGNHVELVSDGAQPGITTPYNLTSYGEHLYFRSSDTANAIGSELWRYSEASGIELVEDFMPGPDGSSPDESVVYQNKLLFGIRDAVLGRELFQFDGSQITLAAKINVGNRSSSPSQAIVYNGSVVFSAKITDSSRDLALMQYDGVNPPELIQNFRSDGINSNNYTGNKVILNNTVYFVTVDEVRRSSLWAFDGSSVSPVLPTNFFVTDWLGVFNGYVYFAADDGSGIGNELWRTDGVNPAELVADINTGTGSSYAHNFVELNNVLYFFAESASYGQELWQYDGVNPPSIASDILPGSGSSWPRYLTVFDNKLYFNATGAGIGQELWVYDGVNPATNAADIVPSWSSSNPQALTVFNGYLYFSANGRSLYRYSEAGGAELVADINTAGDDGIDQIFAHNNTLYFSAHTGDYDNELWQFTDAEGVSLAVNINPIANSSPRNFFSFNNELYFSAYNQQTWGMEFGTELHKLSFADLDATITLDNTASITFHDRFDTPAEAIKAFEFTLSDGGTSDGLPSIIYDLRMKVLGSMPEKDRMQVDWVLVDESDFATPGFYDTATDYLYFPIAPITLADGGSQKFVLYAYFNQINGILDGANFQLSLHTQADLIFDPNMSQPNGNQVTSPRVTVDVNYAPIGFTNSVSLNEDSSRSIQLTASDADGDSLNFFVLSQPQHGKLSGSAPNLVYTPNADYFGSDSFTFYASDGYLNSQSTTVSISVTAVNDKPQADALNLSLNEDDSISVVLSGKDVENDLLTFEIIKQPLNGTVTGKLPNLVYTPHADFFGNDEFSFIANDGVANSTPAVVELTVVAVNDKPIANNQSIKLNEDASINLSLTAMDIENDSLSYILVSEPRNGSLEGSAPNFTYKPNADYFGSDEFAFIANDGVANSIPAVVELTIVAVNDKPIANNQSISLSEDVPINLSLTAIDIENDLLNYILVSEPKNGLLEGSAPNFTYTPNADFFGSDEIVFIANDGVANSTPAVVELTIDAVNDKPIAESTSYILEEDTSAEIILVASDVDKDALTYQVLEAPKYGTLSGEVPNLIYTPNANFNGEDSLTFSASDGQLASNIASINITISSTNDVPTAIGETFELDEDANKSFDLKGTDTDSDELIYTLTKLPDNGEITGQLPSLIYTPNTDYFGQDSISFTVSDGELTSTEANVIFNVSAVNDAPIAYDDFVTMQKNALDYIVLPLENDSDAENHKLILQSANAEHGFLTLDDNHKIIYSPNYEFVGQDIIEYVVEDSEGATAIGFIYINVQSTFELSRINAKDDSVQLQGNNSITIDVLENDVASQQQALTIVAATSEFGEVAISQNLLTFTPFDNFYGELLIEYTVQDQFGQKGSAYVFVYRENSQAPVITLASRDCVQASHLWTEIPQSPVEAISALGHKVSVTANSLARYFLAGVHYRSWLATDHSGVTQVQQEKLCVLPNVSLIANNQSQRQANVPVEIRLSGQASDYPLNLGLTYLLDGQLFTDENWPHEISIESGVSNHFSLDLSILDEQFTDSEVTIQLAGTHFSREHTIQLETSKRANRVELIVEQQGTLTRRINPNAGPVSIYTKVIGDIAPQTLTYSWLVDELAIDNQTTSPAVLRFDPAGMNSGVHIVEVAVSDSENASDIAYGKANIVVEQQVFSRASNVATRSLVDNNQNGIVDTQDRFLSCNRLSLDLNKANAVIEGSNNLCLSLGRFSLLSGRGIEVNNSLFTNHTDLKFISPVYDLSVYEKVDNGQAKTLVIPLPFIIPSDASVMLFEQEEWIDASSQALNIESAFAAAGACDLASTSWQEGLGFGNNCLRITLTGQETYQDLTFSLMSVSGELTQQIEDNIVDVAFNTEREINLFDLLADSFAVEQVLFAYTAFEQLNISELTLKYKAIPEFVGQDIVHYAVKNPEGQIAIGQLLIKVAPNQAPEVVNESSQLELNESISINVLMNDSDPEGNPMLLVMVSHNLSFSADGTIHFTAGEQEQTVLINYLVEDSYGNQSQGQWQIAVAKQAKQSSGSSSPVWLVLFSLLFLRRLR